MEPDELVHSSVRSSGIELGTRISVAAGSLGSRKNAAQAMGVSTDQLARYIRGENEPPVGAVVRLARASGYTIEWLSAGEGEARGVYLAPEQEQMAMDFMAALPRLITQRKLPQSILLSDFALQHGVTEQDLASWISRLNKKTQNVELPLPESGELLHDLTPDDVPEGFVLVPRYDVAASMGNGAAIHSEQVVDHLAFRADWVRTVLGTSPRHLVLISAIGDSMEPTLRAGDLLLIDRSVESVRQDAIYAIAHDGELRVKRIQRLFDGSLVISSDNPSYQREDLSPSQAEHLRIVGRVVWSGRRM